MDGQPHQDGGHGQGTNQSCYQNYHNIYIKLLNSLPSLGQGCTQVNFCKAMHFLRLSLSEQHLKAFRADLKIYPVLQERHRHRTGTIRLH